MSARSILPAVAIAAAALTALGACTSTYQPHIPPAPSSVPKDLRVRMADGAIRRVSLEEYVRGSVLAEVAPSAGDPDVIERMLEVQAVIARSFAIAHRSRHEREGFNLCSSTHCQLYDPARLKTSRWAAAAVEASRRTTGVVLWYGGAAASALFHADCGGHTSADVDVWGGRGHAYLAAVNDDGPAGRAHKRWTFSVDARRLRDALNADERTRVGDRLLGISILRRDASGRATLVALRGSREPIVRGEELRSVLSRAFGPMAIRSTKVDVSRTGAAFVFSGTGFGHGVGLCQAGALARLDAGKSPEEVLAFYYPGTRLVRLR